LNAKENLFERLQGEKNEQKDLVKILIIVEKNFLQRKSVVLNKRVTVVEKGLQKEVLHKK
jgi:hypothetical protein